MKAPQVEPVVIDGPAGALEARAEVPRVDGGAAVAVICHPHPLYQGTMENKVVHTLSRACTRLGVPAVRFNFRGVGASQGEHDAGVGEVEDAVAVVEWARKRWPARPLWLLGFSFGGVIAAQAAIRCHAEQLVSVAPAVRRLKLQLQLTEHLPRWLIVQGEADELVPAEEILEWLNEVPPGPELFCVPGASHFFHGQLTELRTLVETFLAQALTRENLA